MNSTDAIAAAKHRDPALVLASPHAWTAWTALAAVVAGAGLAWNGGWVGTAGALAAAAGTAAWSRRGVATPLVQTESGPQVGRVGAEVMVEQVVPVWSRQMDVTREVANDGLAAILDSFSQMSGSLDTLSVNLESFSVSAAPGEVDASVRRETEALERLLAPCERAFAHRDEAVAELGRCSAGLLELKQLAKQSREIARHSRLVAFNASIEANRDGQRADGGAQAVAAEVRSIAARIAETGEHIDRQVRGMEQALNKTRRAGEIHDTSPEELRLEIQLRAREALNALLSSLGGGLHGSSEVQQACASLRQHLDDVFVNFQFGDRVSQMLSIIGNDMANFAHWVAQNPRATQTDAAEWLAALESSYTMEQQRAHHHDNVHVERSTGVEFF